MALENTDLGDPLIQGDLRSEGMELLTGKSRPSAA